MDTTTQRHPGTPLPARSGPDATLTPLLRRQTGAEKHEPAAHSTLDVLWVLYDRVLRIDPQQPQSPGRDRFLLSKGHGPHAYYAVLAHKGFIPVDWLDDLASPASPLGHHPDRLRIPGVEISSGSLGHGLGLAVGTVHGLRAQGLTAPRVYVLVGDGELDEGSNAEAIGYAGAVGLDTLTTVVVDNHSARFPADGWPKRQFTNAGWTGTRVDSRDHDALETALRSHVPGHPHVVVAETAPRGGGA